MPKISFTDDDLKDAVFRSQSIRQVIIRLGLVPAGGNYETIKNKIESLGLDSSHFKGQGWNRGNRYHPKRNIEEYLQLNGVKIKSYKLKERLIREGIKDEKCECCSLNTWMGEKIPLELEHVNGNRDDNRIENLKLLCPNCHAQTPTYRGKNIGRMAE